MIYDKVDKNLSIQNETKEENQGLENMTKEKIFQP